MAETAPRRAIRTALAEHGMEADEIDYQPIGPMIEMQGFAGGWIVHVRGYGIATGYNWREVVEQIHLSAPMWLDGSLFG